MASTTHTAKPITIDLRKYKVKKISLKTFDQVLFLGNHFLSI
jgi:hypothetical protein